MGKIERGPQVTIMNVHDQVTGSAHLVSVQLPKKESFNFLVDCGMFQENKFKDGNSCIDFNCQEIENVLVTHNHADHTGRIPMLVNRGFENKIYATARTCTLLPEAFKDNFKLMKLEAKKEKKPSLYKQSDTYKALQLLTPLQYHQTVRINPYTRVTALSNGHLPGAAMYLVQISYHGYEDINIVFTGDYNSKNRFFDVQPIPSWIRKLPVTIVTEATYGDMDSSEIKPCFKQNVAKWMKNGKGTVIALVFSLGRAQEILYELRLMQEQGMLDPNIPIYYDGKLSHRYTRILLNDAEEMKLEMRDFLPDNLIWVDKATRNDLLTSKEKKIIVTTSGMGLHGPAQAYIPMYIGRKDTLIHFTGYCPEGTLGYILKNTKIGEVPNSPKIRNKRYATVEYTNEYSGHAKADQLIELLKQFSNIKLVLINHGETSKKIALQTRVIKELNPKDVEILDRETGYRINAYGLIKAVKTKFAKIKPETKSQVEQKKKRVAAQKAKKKAERRVNKKNKKSHNCA